MMTFGSFSLLTVITDFPPVRNTSWSNDSFPIALTYINWETDAIVGVELLQNIGIAIVCIAATTLLTLGSWRGAFLVMVCVLFTCIGSRSFISHRSRISFCWLVVRVSIFFPADSLFLFFIVTVAVPDVAGFMHWWGITIEITSMNILIISVGLCVDFCAHIMHGFLITPGSRGDKFIPYRLKHFINERKLEFNDFNRDVLKFWVLQTSECCTSWRTSPRL